MVLYVFSFFFFTLGSSVSFHLPKTYHSNELVFLGQLRVCAVYPLTMDSNLMDNMLFHQNAAFIPKTINQEHGSFSYWDLIKVLMLLLLKPLGMHKPGMKRSIHAVTQATIWYLDQRQTEGGRGLTWTMKQWLGVSHKRHTVDQFINKSYELNLLFLFWLFSSSFTYTVKRWREEGNRESLRYTQISYLRSITPHTHLKGSSETEW